MLKIILVEALPTCGRESFIESVQAQNSNIIVEDVYDKFPFKKYLNSPAGHSIANLSFELNIQSWQNMVQLQDKDLNQNKKPIILMGWSHITEYAYKMVDSKKNYLYDSWKIQKEIKKMVENKLCELKVIYLYDNPENISDYLFKHTDELKNADEATAFVERLSNLDYIYTDVFELFNIEPLLVKQGSCWTDSNVQEILNNIFDFKFEYDEFYRYRV